MRKWFLVLMLLVLSPAGWPASWASAGQSCLRNGCHHKLTEFRYLHGPVAAEIGGGTGCVICHQPAGPGCTPTRAGHFRIKVKGMCDTCHGKVTGSAHTRSGAEAKCLKCHNPHGSDTSPNMLRRKKK